MSELTQDVWNTLQEHATDAMRRAYCPYSHYPVGAAALVDDGRIVTGCNVENAAYGVTLCAECGVISQLINSGGGRLRAFVCVNYRGDTLVPCGRCRQLLYEHGGDNLQVRLPSGIHPMSDVLPEAFGRHDLDTIKETSND